MSFRKDRYQTYSPSLVSKFQGYHEGISKEELTDLFLEILNGGIHGFCYSLYEEGQEPGHIISEDQIRKRMNILQPHTQWVRSFSCTEGNELIPKIAKENGLKTMAGAWLGSDEEKNEIEIENLIHLCNQGRVDVAAVGNEVLYRNELTMEQLLRYIKTVKEKTRGIPVGYVDAYYEFVDRPEITDICDVILCNCYPYWEGTSFEDSFQHMRHMYSQVKAVANGKRIIISETGWPSKGEGLGGAEPSYENAMKYFINANLWSIDNDIELFYFSSFDEAWKVNSEGEVGAYWGIWDSKGKLKFR